ncbi:MAG TPA: ferritin-like domain-containing protein [Myxococcaceae bacterium]|nr:ferritin-like domain-containing protein [Myxococcaceae bacterium]
MVDPGRQHVDRVWGARYGVETGAALRFGSLSRRMWEAGAPEVLVELAAQASRDETRHASRCEDILRGRQATVPPPETRLLEYAPRDLTPEQRLTYEVVAQSCVSETESMATLVTLLDEARDPMLKAVIHELARDEVNHARIGWGYLAWAKQRMDLGFLAPLLPGMAAGTAGPDLFRPALPGTDEPTLYGSGVVPHSHRQRIYLETLESVVMPGMTEHAVGTGELRAWVDQRRTELEAALPGA